MKGRIGALCASLLLANLSMGCMHGHSEEFKGEAFTTLKEQQIANPDAGLEVKPVEGIASTTADHVSENYHERQKKSHQDDDFEFLVESMPKN